MLIQLSDIHFVSTNGEYPTPENSLDFTGQDNHGRGSLVFYNQATMFHGPETGYDTLAAARAHGHSGKSDAQMIAQEAFTDLAMYFPV